MMDKDWVQWVRSTDEYMSAASSFVAMANQNAGNLGKILCPCKECRNLNHHSIENVYEHLVINGMDPTYTTWYHHGEHPSEAQKPREVEMSDAYNLYSAAYALDDEHIEPLEERRDKGFDKSLEDAETPLYQGCLTYTKLSAIVTLYKLKTDNGWSDESFTDLLDKLHGMFPVDNVLPDSVQAVRNFLQAFQLGYEKIHACVKDCCLFRKENAELENCPKCGSSRWKVDKRTKEIRKGIPAKVLRYMPIIPRFQNMYRSSEMAENLKWHSTHASNDGKMRHLVDSPTWKIINDKWPSFSADPRNLRLGLATDGFNPFSNLSSTYSCWPVMLVTYNLPPWLWMKRENVLLTLLIPRPKQPGNDIDVYSQPLIEDLQELWSIGISVYDKSTDSMFNLRAILLWTMNDFPALGNLAGCKRKGKTACPICGENTRYLWLKFSKKMVYMGHRCFLSPSHPFRKKKAWFDGKEEKGNKPRIMTGSRIKLALKDFKNDWGKGKKRRSKKSKRKRDNEDNQMWKKQSIFFDLPYWEELPVRHNLDVMHIIKTICESFIGTILDMNGKSKDGLHARKDLQNLGIRHDLHPQERGTKTYLPLASHTLSKAEKEIFCKRLFDLKVPDGYSSNIANCVSMEELKITCLKSHDCHVLMRQLLPVAVRGLLPKGPRNAILRLCSFFNKLCQRVIDREEIVALEDEVVETLCMFERFFPPSFFDIMIHLAIHLGREARLCGPVHYRWMFLFERHMKIFKGNVRNRARPEGCIAECYLAEECITFCRRKIGRPANKKVEDKIAHMEKIERETPKSSSTNLKEDALCKVLGPEKNGRLRTFGKGVTLTKLTVLAQMSGHIAQLHEENVQYKSQVAHMQNTIDELMKNQASNTATTEGTQTTPIVSPSRVTTNPDSDCKLLHWMGTGEVVAEGRWSSSDPNERVHHILLGPNAIRVWVDIAKNGAAFLWRPTSDMETIEDAVGTTVAWLADKVLMDSTPRSMG